MLAVGQCRCPPPRACPMCSGFVPVLPSLPWRLETSAGSPWSLPGCGFSDSHLPSFGESLLRASLQVVLPQLWRCFQNCSSPGAV